MIPIVKLGRRLEVLRPDRRSGDGGHVEFLSALTPRRGRLTNILFVSMVVVPTIVTGAYSYFVMSDRYVSEAHFIVRGINSRQSAGINVLFRTIGISRSEDDSYAVLNYLQSRAAVRDLEQELPIRKMFSLPQIDLVSRFPYFWRSTSFESLYDYYQSHALVIRNSSTGITILRSHSVSPKGRTANCRRIDRKCGSAC